MPLDQGKFMKKMLGKIIITSFVLAFAVTAQAAIINTYDWTTALNSLSVQPRADDLTQQSGSTNYIVKGGMHSGGFLLKSLFDSDVNGSYGPGSVSGIFIDEISPDNDTVIHCDFDFPKSIAEVHVFTKSGDRRLFSWFEVWASTTGTNSGDYSYLGTATFGETGDSWLPYKNSNCVARLYDPNDGMIAENVISMMLVQKNCGYDLYKQIPGTSTNGIWPIDSAACRELDIIEVPEPTTPNKEGLKTPYPHWHYFDAMLSYGIGINPFYIDGNFNNVANHSWGPNRGIGSTGRREISVDDADKAIFKYDMRNLGDQAWYVLQAANDWSIEFSSNGTDWVFGGSNTPPNNSSDNENFWYEKPYTNESPYYFSLSTFLPSDNLYVRFGNAASPTGPGALLYNALITAKGYPYFNAGGCEPSAVHGRNGDQQWLYIKDNTSDSDNETGRYADGTQKFVYKFDLPDDEDNCWLHTRVSGEYLLEISTDNEFSTIDLVSSNNPGVATERFLHLPLKNDVLSKTSDNVIYVRFSDSDPKDAIGANPKDFWIAPYYVTSSTKSFHSGSEEELPYLWYDNYTYLDGKCNRSAYDSHMFTYRVNYDPNCKNGTIKLVVHGEFLIECSSNDTDWVTIANAGSGHSGREYVIFNPFSGNATGYKTEDNIPKFCPNIYNGNSNVFFLRMRDCAPGHSGVGVIQDMTIIADSGESLGTATDPYSIDDHLISSSVFSWYTPDFGQLKGTWLPREGRANWTGEPDWWQTQVKQMMLAGLDILYVQLSPNMELQRINLFQALYELRKEGYDVPKVVPFLDTKITWRAPDGDMLVYSLAIESNRTMLVDQYIRFFRQFYLMNPDEHADDYIGIIDNKVMLNNWYLIFNFTQISSFQRSDMEAPLAAEFGAEHPVFNNGIYMIVATHFETFAWADEHVEEFYPRTYYSEINYNGIKSYTLNPGFWDQNIKDPGTFIPRDGGTHYIDSWELVNNSTATRAYLESWNEYDQGSGLYAVYPEYIYRLNGNTAYDVWSTTDDPLEYIKTTLNGAREFKSSEIEAKNSEILWHNIPTDMVVGETNHCYVYVRNTGFDLWKSNELYSFGQRLEDDTAFGPGRYYFSDNDVEADLYLGVFKGRPVKFDVDVIAPIYSGIYETHWRMVQDGVAWFGETITNTIYVRPIPEPGLIAIFILTFLSILYCKN